MCYNLTTERTIVGGGTTEIKFWSDKGPVPKMRLYFTSEKNSYGITGFGPNSPGFDWREGKVFQIETKNGYEVAIDLTVEKHIYLECSEQSVYECFTSKVLLSKSDQCNITCMPLTLPQDEYPICEKCHFWDKESECPCIYQVLADVYRNITTNDECPRTCIMTQYSGTITCENELEQDYSWVHYKFAAPFVTKVFEEYVICDLITMIGSVGGTFGLFIGFSFTNMFDCIIKYLQRLLPAFKNYFRISNTVFNNDNDNGTSQKQNLNKTTVLDRFALMEIQLEQTEEKVATMEKKMKSTKKKSKPKGKSRQKVDPLSKGQHFNIEISMMNT